MAFFVEASLCDEAQRVRQQVDANGWDLVNMQVVLGQLFYDQKHGGNFSFACVVQFNWCRKLISNGLLQVLLPYI